MVGQVDDEEGVDLSEGHHIESGVHIPGREDPFIGGDTPQFSDDLQHMVKAEHVVGIREAFGGGDSQDASMLIHRELVVDRAADDSISKGDHIPILHEHLVNHC